MYFRRSVQKFLESFVRGQKNKKPGQYSKRSQIGLYAGKDIRFGNMISFSHRKTRRTWKPNVQLKSLWSETLDRWIRFHITTHAIRCVDKAGGIDSYLLSTSDKRLNSVEGSRAKREIEEVLARRRREVDEIENVEDASSQQEEAFALPGEGWRNEKPLTFDSTSNPEHRATS